MVILNEHFKEVEKRLGFPQEAVEIFEKTATRIGASCGYAMPSALCELDIKHAKNTMRYEQEKK